MELKLSANKLTRTTLDGITPYFSVLKNRERKYIKELAFTIRRLSLISTQDLPWDNRWQENVPHKIATIEFELFDFIDSLYELHLDKIYTERVLQALIYSALVHKNKIRTRERKPYIVHPLRVSTLVLDFLTSFQGNSINIVKSDKHASEIIIAALLHDSVEDHALSLVRFDNKLNTPQSQIRSAALKVIEKRYGLSVRHWLATLSKPSWSEKDKSCSYFKWVNLIWEDGSAENTIIKLSDILDNLDASLKDIERIFKEKLEGKILNQKERQAHKKDWELVVKYLSILMLLKSNYDSFLRGTLLATKSAKAIIIHEIDKRIQKANEVFRALSLADNELLLHIKYLVGRI